MFARVPAVVLALCGTLSLGLGIWIPVKAAISQILLHRAWNETRISGQVVKPWPWADTWPVGRLIHERTGVDQIILEGGSGEALAFGPAHLTDSAEPGGPGHCILSGHRDTSFAFLEELQHGDELLVEGHGGTQRYRVKGAETVEADGLYLDGELAGTLSLITCYPFRAVLPRTPLRFVVTARAAVP